MKGNHTMFSRAEIEAANKTSRASSAIGHNAITPRYVREHVEMFYDKETTTILDFGAGKTAYHARIMLADGFLITAHEFGKNINSCFHNELALSQNYHIVYASNVLNVQSGSEMIRETIRQVVNVLKDDGKFFANYPASPRKSNITPKEMMTLLLERFEEVTRVGGTTSAPLWCCVK